MGIINATPDSFYSASRVNNSKDAIEIAKKMISDGAKILDIGGYSSRPGAKDISEEEELDRVLPLIHEIKERNKDILVSIDTFRSKVAEEAIKAGADIINDISGGLKEPEIFEISAKYGVPYILMHMQGTPQNMMFNTSYSNLMEDIHNYFEQQIKQAKEKGVTDIIIDPGFGFSKNLQQNYKLLKELPELNSLNCPILVGISRKSMIYKRLGNTAEESLNGTSVLNTIALLNGAGILRVHDVKEAVECVKLTSHLFIGE